MPLWPWHLNKFNGSPCLKILSSGEAIIKQRFKDVSKIDSEKMPTLKFSFVFENQLFPLKQANVTKTAMLVKTPISV